ncbi:hypothetical protein PR202_gb28364 [Eleusine coracana subsp. coracana]|uniref:TFIIS N-terminal domain-containing protein n=1 Tax=Eleusine coracana subsp. coracana TaxID=191504 RepID=A0AAV5FWI2_ELECO|nr:hypothetical protein QOZ80_6AG0549310 [Eleusine coracana subsp. coracana]KAK3134481.1 hypothetical protein QOZ80_6AG0549750 [Eleusine coracana subsp. coracana]GJN39214.1 hypothetical protein PR202_gb28318 [Eleusine coracana subsp. coracana]GJN39259.1 hypothetical protein PR202_gb28364 [Eleusine coracana subsp. coracana]
MASRWRRSLTSLEHIDAAIEAADPSVSRDEFRRLRAEIVEMLCAGDDEDDKTQQRRILILDGVMAESLLTLQSAVTAEVVPRLLASQGDLANVVGSLRSHHGSESERVRGLARDIISGWKASVEGDIARMNAAMAKLDALSSQPCENAPKKDIRREDKKTAEAPGPRKMADSMMPNNKEREHKIQENRPVVVKKMAPVVVVRSSDRRAKVPEASPLPKKKTDLLSPEERMEATKRKLHEGYQEAADAKRQRKIQVIPAPKVSLEQRQGKTMQPIVRDRSRDRLGNTTTAVRRSLLPSLHRV